MAEIAAAAGVSTKTFFNYFASKDEVLSPHLSRRIDAAVALMERARTGLAELAERRRGGDAAHAGRRPDARKSMAGLAAVRLPMLIVSVPRRPSGHAAPLLSWPKIRLAAGAPPRLFQDALDRRGPPPPSIGSVMGAAIAAALVCLQEGTTTEKLQVAVENAVGIAIHGIRSVSTSA